jgi:multiple sugar transport system ATP-binding protein
MRVDPPAAQVFLHEAGVRGVDAGQQGPPGAADVNAADHVRRFVAGFIGSPSMNFLEGEMTAAGFTTADGIVLPVAGAARGATTYGIRPEHLVFAPDGVEMEVSVIEPTGSETQALGRLGTQPISGVFRERLQTRPGSKIRIMPDLSQVHLFDRNGARLN